MTKLTGEFTVTAWDEEAYSEREGARKLTRASVTQNLRRRRRRQGPGGMVDGYAEDGTAHFVGLQVSEGVIDGREGTAVLQTIGEFNGKEATWNAEVVDGSGPAAWSSMRGQGQFRAPHGNKATFTLDCSLD